LYPSGGLITNGVSPVAANIRSCSQCSSRLPLRQSCSVSQPRFQQRSVLSRFLGEPQCVRSLGVDTCDHRLESPAFYREEKHSSRCHAKKPQEQKSRGRRVRVPLPWERRRGSLTATWRLGR